MRSAKIKSDLIVAAVERLNKGELNTPIEIKGNAAEKRLLALLDQLRKNMRDARDETQRIVSDNNTAIASVAHDLKTPLAIISGYAESLQDGIDNQDYLSLIIEKTQQMNQQVLTLVETAKQERETAPLNRERVNARDFFVEEFGKYRNLAKAKNVTLTIGKAPNAVLYIDKEQIARVIQNLLSNALKYTPEKGKIKVGFKASGVNLRVAVCDNGEGIAKKNLPFVFDKFFREDKARTNLNSGLGLYIAKDSIEKHGGSITVKSVKYQGSTFSFYLPLENEKSPAKDFSAAFDSLPPAAQLILDIFCGWSICWIYRFARYTKFNRISTLAGAFIAFPLFVVFWFLDIGSILAYKHITYLAE